MSNDSVMALGVGAVGITIIAEISKGKPSMRPVIGGFLYVGALLAIESGSPQVATGLAVLVFTTALVLNGIPFFTAIGNASSAPLNKTTKSTLNSVKGF